MSKTIAFPNHKNTKPVTHVHLPIIINEGVTHLIRAVDMATIAGGNPDAGVTVKLVASAWSGSNLATDKDPFKKNYGKAAKALLKAIEKLPEVQAFIEANKQAHESVNKSN